MPQVAKQPPAGRVKLLPRKSLAVESFTEQLASRFIGQPAAVEAVTAAYQVLQAGLHPAGRPMGNFLFLGPTGSGKTRMVEALAEVLFGAPRAFVKINCAEFQHSHEVAKLLGSPPGYLGHKETRPLLTQERLEEFHTEKHKFSLVLFDEVEKAHESVWQLLLGVLDKAELTLGDNRRTRFDKTLIFMTSNLGAREMQRLLQRNGMGFVASGAGAAGAVTQEALHAVALEAAKRHFSPEFMNRLDKVVVFEPLREAQLLEVLGIELRSLALRLLAAKGIRLQWMRAARQQLLREGTSSVYGARPLKRVLEQQVVAPLAALLAGEGLQPGDTVEVSWHAAQGWEFFRVDAPRTAEPFQKGKSDIC